MAHIQAIYRYPVKGLSPEPLAHTTLTPGETVPGDRLYAIENGPSGFDAAARPYLSKQHFLMLMKNECLASLRTAFDLDSHMLTIDIADLPSAASGGRFWREAARGDLRTKEGRLAIEAFFRRFMPHELRGPPKILYAEGHSFSDVALKVVSIINLASVSAIEDMVGVPVNPLRFRANLYVEGWSAWSELDWVGKELSLGSAVRLKIVKRIVRCAATNVDPNTGLRDLEVPQAIMRAFGHADCGVYAEVVGGGEVRVGDGI
jgi:uncharacterized protein YcbX